MIEREIIDKIKGIACYGDEFHAVYLEIERLKAVTACAISYCDEVFDGGEPYVYIEAMFRLIEDIAKEIDSGLDKSTKVILDTCN